MKNIVLIGFAGCGKTSIGDKLSEILENALFDSDKEIEAVSSMAVSDIFSAYGECIFRNIESSIIEKLSKNTNSIIATGGGCVKRRQNIEYLKENGIIIYLKSSPEKIFDNLKNDNTRPLLQNTENNTDAAKMERIKTLISERSELYEKYADITVDISRLDIGESANAVLEAINCRYNTR